MRGELIALSLCACVGFGIALGGCASQMAKSLGSLPVVVTQGGDASPELDAALESGCGYLIKVYRVDSDGAIVPSASTDNGVYRVADVSGVYKDFFLGTAKDPSAVELAEASTTAGADAAAAKGTRSTSEEEEESQLQLSPELERKLKAKRAVIALKLMEIADTNGAEYWRRFSGLIAYKQAARAGEKALMGAGIASTFISPVLGASLTGAGLAFDATTDSLTAGFDIETYTALRDAVRAAVIDRRKLIQAKLRDRSYLSYPASAVIADVSDYAHVYSVRGAIDAMKAAMADRVLVAQGKRSTKAPEPTSGTAPPAATPPAATPPAATPPAATPAAATPPAATPGGGF